MACEGDEGDEGGEPAGQAGTLPAEQEGIWLLVGPGMNWQNATRLA